MKDTIRQAKAEAYGEDEEDLIDELDNEEGEEDDYRY